MCNFYVPIFIGLQGKTLKKNQRTYKNVRNKENFKITKYEQNHKRWNKKKIKSGNQ